LPVAVKERYVIKVVELSIVIAKLLVSAVSQILWIHEYANWNPPRHFMFESGSEGVIRRAVIYDQDLSVEVVSLEHLRRNSLENTPDILFRVIRDNEDEKTFW
jgi:hypothetical protein